MAGISTKSPDIGQGKQVSQQRNVASGPKKGFLQNFDYKTEVRKVMVCGFVKVIGGKEGS